MKYQNPPSRPSSKPVELQELFETTTLTYRKLDYWCRQGLIPHHENERLGSGNRREFTDAEVRFISLMNRLVDAGFAPADASDAVVRGFYMGKAFVTFPAKGMVLYLDSHL